MVSLFVAAVRHSLARGVFTGEGRRGAVGAGGRLACGGLSGLTGAAAIEGKVNPGDLDARRAT